MRPPHMTERPLAELFAEGWSRIYELQRRVNKMLEVIPHPGEFPPDVSNSELHEILSALPEEFTDYVLLLPNRGSNVEIYDGRLVTILAYIVLARRLGPPLNTREIKSLLTTANECPS